MPVLVQNNQTGPAVFADGKDINLEWQAKGHPAGEDVQYVPDEVLSNAQFVKAIRRGIFTVVQADEEVLGRLAAQDAAYARRQEASLASALSAIDPSVNNDLISLPCIGPAERGTGFCGVDVAVREKHRDDAPILCDRHKALSSTFAQIETGETKVQGDSLVPVKRWVRSTIGGRETAPLA